MSLFTEKADLEAVIERLKELDYVDSRNIFLIGTSQGGAVSAITGADHLNEIKGMILLYPALILSKRGITPYNKDVLIIHGDQDEIVPLSYSERAIQVYPNAELKVINGAGHGFYGEDFQKAMSYILEFLTAYQT